MFRLLKSVLAPMSAMRIDAQNESPADLQQKLHLITQHLINSNKQFDSWMELQNINQLHHCLSQIFSRAESDSSSGQGVQMGVSEEEAANIIQFYTLLLINAKDELLICKLVSDDFVIRMCRLDRVHSVLAADLEAYRINLIRAYLTKITPEIVKYMVIQDKFKVFETCVQLFCHKLGTGTVEFTTISNTLLNVLTKVDSICYLWENVWVTQGLQLLYTGSLHFILNWLRGHKIEGKSENNGNIDKVISEQEQIKRQQNEKANKIDAKQKQPQIQTGQHESTEEKEDQNKIIEMQKPSQSSAKCILSNMDELEEIVLFLIEVRSSVHDANICQQIDSYSYLYLKEIEECVWLYPDHQTRASVFSALFALFKTYTYERQAIEGLLDNHLDALLHYLQMVAIKKSSTPEQNKTLSQSVFMLNRVVLSKYSQLSERNLQSCCWTQNSGPKITSLRVRILSILIKIIENCLEFFQCSPTSLLLQFIKYLLPTVFYLKIAMSATPQADTHSDLFQKLNEAILQLFLSYNVQLKKLMSKSELWNDVIKWYQEASNRATQNLLTPGDTLEHKSQDPSYTVLLTYQYLRNYRYMIVEHTTLEPKFIKQQKFYHSTFFSVGLTYEPGTVINASLHTICHCLFHHNGQQIPVAILEDKQCLLIGMKLANEEFKILINIKFKDVEGFVYGNSQAADGKNNSELPRFIKINLKGCQQIVLQFSNPRVAGNALKEYLIKSRDMNRQRQLKFLNQWIKDYQLDTEKCLQKVKHHLRKQDYKVL